MIVGRILGDRERIFLTVLFFLERERVFFLIFLNLLFFLIGILFLCLFLLKIFDKFLPQMRGGRVGRGEDIYKT